MLDPLGPFKESRPENGQVIFPEDNARALQIVLYITHLKFHSIPATLNFTQLLNLAIICDKYDTARLILPWFHKWEKDFRESAVQPGYEQSLLIAWVFRDLETFKRVVAELVWTVCVNSEGDCFERQGLTPLGEHMPPGIIGLFESSSRIYFKPSF